MGLTPGFANASCETSVAQMPGDFRWGSTKLTLFFNYLEDWVLPRVLLKATLKVTIAVWRRR